MSESIGVNLFKASNTPFREMLGANGIEFADVEPRSGVAMASGSLIEILSVAGPVTASLAAVLIAWIRSRSSRKVIVTTRDKRTVHIEGLSAEEVEQILRSAERLSVIDTENQSKP